jgi:hypothetical protein
MFHCNGRSALQRQVCRRSGAGCGSRVVMRIVTRVLTTPRDGRKEESEEGSD